MEAFLIRYGLFAVAVGPAIEGDITLILAGVVAHLGYFDLLPAMLVGSVGALASDCVWYGIGRGRADTIQSSRVYRRVRGTVERLADRLGTWELLAARSIYGTRVASLLFWGVRRLSVVRFLIFDFLGCAVWALSLAVLGYLLSSSAAAVVGEVKRVELWLLGAVVVAVSIYLTIGQLPHPCIRRIGSTATRRNKN